MKVLFRDIELEVTGSLDGVDGDYYNVGKVMYGKANVTQLINAIADEEEFERICYNTCMQEVKDAKESHIESNYDWDKSAQRLITHL